MDGTNVRAQNSKDNAYNAEILVKMLARINEHIKEYLSQLDANDRQEILFSPRPEDIQTCLHAGVLPRCYEGKGLEVELREQGAEGCFTRNENGTVTCSMGETLHKVKDKGRGVVYANKDACRQCTNRCTDSKGHKTVLFGPDTKHVAVKMCGGQQDVVNGVCVSQFILPDRQREEEGVVADS